jgi:hypothetical protein
LRSNADGFAARLHRSVVGFVASQKLDGKLTAAAAASDLTQVIVYALDKFIGHF